MTRRSSWEQAAFDVDLLLEAMIAFWKESYPGYAGNVQYLERAGQLAEHLVRLREAWVATFVAFEAARAARAFWPCRCREWLWVQAKLLKRPYAELSKRYRIPALVLRFYAWRHGLWQPQALWHVFGWIVRGSYA